MIKGTENYSVGDLIGRRVPFFVPKYQRGYAWEEEEIGDYISDMEDLFARRQASADKPLRHFFGGFVSIESFLGNSTTGRTFELVDGQQRMATFVITLSLIVDALKRVAAEARVASDRVAENTADAEAVLTRKNFVVYEEVVGSGIEQRLRVSLSKADRAFFELLINRNGVQSTRDSHRRLVAAQREIETRLINGTVAPPAIALAERISRLINLRKCLVDDCHVVHIYSDDRPEAFRLFRVLNDRGRAIGDGDKLRSHTLELTESSPAVQAAVEEAWDRILAVGQSDTDDFLRTYLNAYTAKRTPKRDLFAHICDEFFDPDKTVGDMATAVHGRIQSFEKSSVMYRKICEGEWPLEGTRVSAWRRNRLHRLVVVLRHALALPLLLAAAEILTEQEFAELVLSLERFAFRYVSIASGHHNPPAGIYVKAIEALRQGSFSLGDFRAQLQGIMEKHAPASVFESNLVARLDYLQQANRKLIRHFLSTIDDHLAWLRSGGAGRPRADEVRSLDLNELTIEHVYPQNAVPADTDSLLEPTKQKLGNLSIWGPDENNNAGNDRYAKKLTKYSASVIGLNRELASVGHWELADCEARQRLLVEFAVRLFVP